MTTITNWWFSQPGIGIVGVYSDNYGYAGGVALVGVGNTYNKFGVINLGGGNIALSTVLTDDNGNSTTFYLNSHFAVSNDSANNVGMLLLSDPDPSDYYASTSLGAEQTFKLVNLGGGNVALQATAGAFPGQYLNGMQNGWYPEQWGLGSGSLYATASPSPFVLHGPLLPLLVITNSGYQLDLSRQNLAGINLDNANMQQCNLSQADLSGITGLQGADFTGANLQNANLTGLSLTGANWTAANFTNTSLTSISTAQQANLTNAILTHAALTKVNLQGANLTGASLVNAALDGAALTGANITGASLGNASFLGAALNGANLSNVQASAADFTGADLSNANLSGATLTGANLSKTNLSGANLTGANLTYASLVDANLTGANLTNCNFSFCDPNQMILANNVIAGANFSGLNLTAVKFAAALIQPPDPTNRAVFAGATLPFTAFGLNWSCLDLTNTTFTGLPTNLSGLKAAGMRRPNGSFQNFALDKADFTQATLGNAVFTGAHLDGARFDGANLTGAVFTRAKMNETTFIGAALGGVTQNQAAVFSYAYLGNCKFAQANLFGASFAGATLVGSNSFHGSVNLQETDFSNAYLPNVNFMGANLQGAKFDGAFMVECNLSSVDLSPTREGSVAASLTAACLQAVTFQQTNLAGADLSNAAITDAAGTISMQYYDQNGNLTPPFALPYPAGSFPEASSLSAMTICPNGATYGSNQQNGLSLADMMIATDPPTKWSPADQVADPANGRAAAPAGRSGARRLAKAG